MLSDGDKATVTKELGDDAALGLASRSTSACTIASARWARAGRSRQTHAAARSRISSAGSATACGSRSRSRRRREDERCEHLLLQRPLRLRRTAPGPDRPLLRQHPLEPEGRPQRGPQAGRHVSLHDDHRRELVPRERPPSRIRPSPARAGFGRPLLAARAGRDARAEWSTSTTSSRGARDTRTSSSSAARSTPVTTRRRRTCGTGSRTFMSARSRATGCSSWFACGFILDECCRPVDGLNVGGRVPYTRDDEPHDRSAGRGRPLPALRPSPMGVRALGLGQRDRWRDIRELVLRGTQARRRQPRREGRMSATKTPTKPGGKAAAVKRLRLRGPETLGRIGRSVALHVR